MMKKTISSHNYVLLLAIEKGYSMDKDGNLLNKSKEIVKGHLCDGYLTTTIRYPKSRKSRMLKIHKLQAYQKFGDKLFEEGVVVRHLNGNKTDNSWDNIEIGTQSDNMMDIPEEKRVAQAIRASQKTRKFTDNEITEIREFHTKEKSYKKTMDKFNISSKGTLNYILKHQYKTTK